MRLLVPPAGSEHHARGDPERRQRRCRSQPATAALHQLGLGRNATRRQLGRAGGDPARAWPSAPLGLTDRVRRPGERALGAHAHGARPGALLRARRPRAELRRPAAVHARAVLGDGRAHRLDASGRAGRGAVPDRHARGAGRPHRTARAPAGRRDRARGGIVRPRRGALSSTAASSTWTRSPGPTRPSRRSTTPRRPLRSERPAGRPPAGQSRPCPRACPARRPGCSRAARPRG